MSSETRDSHELLKLALCSAILIVQLFAANVWAEKAEMPKNSSPRSYGSGWDCDSGYRQVNNTCDQIVLTENAYLTNQSYGSGWACKRGYLIDGLACVAIKVPANGYLSDSSYKPGSKCERGYQALKDSCIAVNVPPHGYLA